MFYSRTLLTVAYLALTLCPSRHCDLYRFINKLLATPTRIIKNLLIEGWLESVSYWRRVSSGVVSDSELVSELVSDSESVSDSELVSEHALLLLFHRLHKADVVILRPLRSTLPPAVHYPQNTCRQHTRVAEERLGVPLLQETQAQDYYVCGELLVPGHGSAAGAEDK